MNQKELKELVDFLIERDISEFELERGDVKVRIKRGVAVQAAPVIQQVPMVAAAPLVSQPPHAAPPGPPASSTASEEDLHIVKSPIVGTFYESPSPGAPPFVKPGDNVNAGQVMCIIEAMKLMNEIECDMAGEIVKRLVNNSQPVEYGQPLFAIRPSR
ncbi:MAG: acetyl-CoA carboxylase biotin carboxyl carrier protein [Acidobacteriia bacterium]|nr:acetyl-CoA carboxylase biotin carboxyl carrier protein [Terriglobia bacterium]